ncbi:hypothetical protein SKAU_G00005200 [Synaphobranchus kaupii]|uniref:Uncharacterized protein n=1 Tax=Synaphobranchus kaupii TaxID=118154 RepID=A0A9Q1GAN1_SYNKA|nr:hypothetical protein SKAU_G00005200 [Synaphobranchus kaupii]
MQFSTESPKEGEFERRALSRAPVGVDGDASINLTLRRRRTSPPQAGENLTERGSDLGPRRRASPLPSPPSRVRLRPARAINDDTVCQLHPTHPKVRTCINHPRGRRPSLSSEKKVLS